VNTLREKEYKGYIGAKTKRGTSVQIVKSKGCLKWKKEREYGR